MSGQLPKITLSLVAKGLALTVAAVVFAVIAIPQANTVNAADGDEHLVTIHDRGAVRTILTKQTALKDALREAGYTLDANDRVEPGLDKELVARDYQVNIYRARPIVIQDGNIKQLVMSAYQTPKQIAEHAGITLQDEDIASLAVTDSLIRDGASMVMRVDRAAPITLVLYGKKQTVYTQATTVADFLKDKEITIGKKDTLSVKTDESIKEGMKIEIWRNGKQTITRDESIDFEVKQIEDGDRPVGYTKVTEPGVKGKKTVTYEVIMKNGKEVKRKKIQSVVIKKASTQIETIGIKTSDNPLTKGMGVNQFKDSKGIVHRETYYDLPMSVVMGNCGANGDYKVRSDGAKVDKKGYVIIAAHLSRYPRCSVVETSMGLGKVYDTGGFVAAHPDGFDLATDWSNGDGR